MTTLENVIIPEVFSEYVTQRTMELSALIQSGIITNTEEFNSFAAGPSTLVNMPFWEDLVGEEETVEEGGVFEIKNITANKDVARKQMYGNAWGANGLSALLSGDDPLRAITNLVGEYWARRLQARLLATLQGVFDSSTMVEKHHDISGLSDGILTGDTFLDATQKMGDAKGLLTGVMMHFAVENHLVKRGLIEYIPESETNPRMPVFMNKRVHIDDSMAYDTSTKIGSMYLFGAGAIALGNGAHDRILKTEIARDSLDHSGVDVLINRQINILHPRGVKWQEKNVAKNFPTHQELKSGKNWERVFEPKAVRIVKHTFKID